MSRGNGPDHDPGGGRSSESVCYKHDATNTSFGDLVATSYNQVENYGYSRPSYYYGGISVKMKGYVDDEGTFYASLPPGATPE